MRKLPRSFFTRPSLTVAKDLLGTYIVRVHQDKKRIGKIVGVEAYPGPYDKASHAFGMKRTKRNEVEYRKGGYVYIYLVYGMYFQLNITTGKAEYPECVLIRALEPILNNQQLTMHKNATNGPGKLCNWLKINKSFYGEDVLKSDRLWLETGEKVKKSDIVASPRIGIDYAGMHYATKPWRFYIKDKPFVSC